MTKRFLAIPQGVKIALALGTIYLIWGSTYLAIRFTIETLPPFLMSGARFLLAGIIMYGIMRLRGEIKPTWIHWRSAAIVGGLLLMGGNGSVVWGEQYIPSSIAALLVATVPLWMVLLDWLWKGNARPTGVVVSGIVLGFTGIIFLVTQGDFSSFSHLNPLGVGAVLFAALSWATGSIYSRSARLPKSPLLATGMEMIAGGLLLFAASVVNGEWAALDLAGVSMRSFLSWVYLLIAGSMIGLSCYIWLLRVAPASRVATYAYVNPVVAVLLGWSLADEPLTWQTLLASSIIIASVFLITTRARSGPGAVPPEKVSKEPAKPYPVDRA